ncbi:MAG: Glu/Leu/Phe/Val dehydrogenase dimerization domain-containing protein [Promethearchaeati archaeon]
MKFNIKDYSLFDEYGPEKIININNPSIGLKAALVIDNSAYGIPAGGIRLLPDIELDEMIRLARAMSLKFCSYKMKTGGAKAGIWGDPTNEKEKNILLTGFAKQIEPFIKNDFYYPGPDMGTNDDDLLKIFKVIGAPNLAPNKLNMYKNGVPVEELFTGYGVVYCLEVIYNNLDKLSARKRDKSKKPKVILEGFGKVGTAMGMSLNEIGFDLTGLSTIKGAIFDENGLDIEKLLKLKKEYGDNLVHHYESKDLIEIEKEKLFELSSDYHTDFIIPGARPDVINNQNIDNIDAIAIVPAANIPYEEGIFEKLKEKEIIAFPDFVANAGEILAIWVNKVAKNPEEIFDFIKQKISNKALEVIQGAAEKNMPPYDFAVKVALEELDKKIKRRTRKLEKLNKRY